MKFFVLFSLALLAGSFLGTGELVRGITWHSYAFGGMLGFLLAMPFARWML